MPATTHPLAVLSCHPSASSCTAQSEMPRAARLLGLVLACLLSASTAAPLVQEVITSPRSSNSSSSNDTVSSSIPAEESTPVFVVPSTTVAAASSPADLPQSSTLDTTEQDQLTSSLQSPTEDVFDSDEAIRHLPGYWIKRPGEDEDQEHEGVASFIDYRTELYQIADLFATEPLHDLAAVDKEKQVEEDPAAVCSDSSSKSSSSSSSSSESSTGPV
ncbi:hypothetical protein B566_EDAN004021 [Ephemera danica]|nr:hypothetical protein B566_EDAN004021 [Ephemera danica]